MGNLLAGLALLWFVITLTGVVSGVPDTDAALLAAEVIGSLVGGFVAVGFIVSGLDTLSEKWRERKKRI